MVLCVWMFACALQARQAGHPSAPNSPQAAVFRRLPSRTHSLSQIPAPASPTVTHSTTAGHTTATPASPSGLLARTARRSNTLSYSYDTTSNANVGGAAHSVATAPHSPKPAAPSRSRSFRHSVQQIGDSGETAQHSKPGAAVCFMLGDEHNAMRVACVGAENVFDAVVSRSKSCTSVPMAGALSSMNLPIDGRTPRRHAPARRSKSMFFAPQPNPAEDLKVKVAKKSESGGPGPQKSESGAHSADRLHKVTLAGLKKSECGAHAA